MSADELREVRDDIKGLIRSTAILQSNVESMRLELMKCVPPCAGLQAHLEEQRGAFRWVMQTVLAPALAAVGGAAAAILGAGK